MNEKKETGAEIYKKPEMDVIPLESDIITASECPNHDPNAGTWI